MHKLFFTIGLLFIILGILDYLFHGHLFRLPGDIVIKKENFSVYFPITSMILISIILSVLFSLYTKFFH